MAIYHFSMTRAERAAGRSAVALAAYRAGERLRDERTGQVHDYCRKDVLHAEIVLPADAPEWARDRSTLWNRSERSHIHPSAIVARDIEISLPHELPHEERVILGLKFARLIVNRYGVAVDIGFHPPSREGDDRNYHAHLLMTTRPFDPDGREGFGNVIRDFDPIARQRVREAPIVDRLREEWCDMANRSLERHQIELDHRSFERQGIDREPTIKEGMAANQRRRRGLDSERAEINDGIRERNAERDDIGFKIERAGFALVDLLREVRGTSLYHQLKWEGAPSLQAAFSIEERDRERPDRPSNPIMALHETMLREAERDGRDKPTASQIMREYKRLRGREKDGRGTFTEELERRDRQASRREQRDAFEQRIRALGDDWERDGQDRGAGRSLEY